MSAIYGLNTSRVCTGTADSRIFPDFFPGTKTPCGEPGHRSGITGDVIHFNATQATMMGHQCVPILLVLFEPADCTWCESKSTLDVAVWLHLYHVLA
jgi:hypothetical protein